MRRWRALVLAMVMAAGCSHRVPQPPRAREVVFWETWPSGAILQVLARFEAENPGLRVSVKILPQASARDTIAAAVATGHTPDLCQFASTDLPAYLASGALSDWSAGVADQRDSLIGWPTCMVGDAIYALPWLLDTRALYFNPALLARARLDPARPPGTWAELETAAARVQRLGQGVRGVGIASGEGDLFATYMSFAWGDSVRLLSAGGDSSGIGSPRAVEALEFLVHLRHNALLAERERVAGEFAAGRLGFLLEGASLLARFRDRPASARPGVAPVPRPSARFGHHASLATAQLLASFTTSKRKEDALRLARFLVREDNVLLLVAAMPGTLPANRGADSAAYYRTRPAERTLVAQLEGASFAPARRDWDGSEKAIEAQLALALEGGKSASQAIADADTCLDSLVSRRGKAGR